MAWNFVFPGNIHIHPRGGGEGVIENTIGRGLTEKKSKHMKLIYSISRRMGGEGSNQKSLCGVNRDFN